MATKHQFVDIEIPGDFTPSEREEIAQEILDHIRERSAQGIGVKQRRNRYVEYALPEYSESYIKSQAFRAAGKSAGDVNLYLSGDMLAEMDLLSHRKGKIRLGFERGTESNAKADGNIRGTYGKSSENPRKARSFLGITEDELERILSKYEGGE